MIKKTMIVIAGVLISSASVAADKKTALQVIGGKPVIYQCTNGKKVTARYYDLSDNSLSFVKVIVDNREYTLPQAISASGARYTDDRKIEWWADETALLNENITNPASRAVECKEPGSAILDKKEKKLQQDKKALKKLKKLKKHKS